MALAIIFEMTSIWMERGLAREGFDHYYIAGYQEPYGMFISLDL